MRASTDYIVIDGAEWAVEIASDGEYVGDPLELRGTNTVVTAADCPCGETAWAVDHRGYWCENVFIVCECGKEYPLQSRKAGAA